MKFLNALRQLHINIFFINSILQIPNYTKFLKEMLTKKRKQLEYESVALSEECSAILNNKLPHKLKDPVSFTPPCSVGNSHNVNILIDFRASINLMPFIFTRNSVLEPKETSIKLQISNRSIKHPHGRD